jgi:hypothetical protein
VELSKLGLAPPKTKPKSPLPSIPIQDLLAQSHAVLSASAKKERLLSEFIEAKKKYTEELTLALNYGYLEGRTRIPKRLRVKE